jgi:hypothetical protein
MNNSIHICYRREEGQAEAGRICTRLRERFGRDRDVIEIAAGMPAQDVNEEIDAVGFCAVLLVVIGKKWLACTDADGRRWVDDPQDPVRQAIAKALRRYRWVVPVLVQGASLPREEELPDDLKPLARHEAVSLRDTEWEGDLGGLLNLIEDLAQRPPAMAPPPTAEPEQTLWDETAPAPAAAKRSIWGALTGIFGSRRSRSKRNEEEQEERSAVEGVRAGPAYGSGADAAPVLLGVSAPRAVKPGGEFTARFAAYVKGIEEEVRAILKKLSPRSEAVLGIEECRWQPGTEVTVRLASRNLAIDPPEQSFVWEGKRSLLDFDVSVPANAAEGTVVLKFDVLIDGIVMARLRLDLEISARAVAGEPTTATARSAHSAFASYSSADRARVLDRVAAVRIAAGLDVFVDCLDLHPGEAWKPRLDQEILRRDLFLLFWSRHASESEWVTWEWQTALKDKGKDHMQIHPLDPDAKPPEELADLHFGDVTMWVRRGG